MIPDQSPTSTPGRSASGHEPGTLLVVTGLSREARIAAGLGVGVVVGGGRSDLLWTRLHGHDDRPLTAVISFGIAGALDPALRVGDIVVASAVVSRSATITSAAALRSAWTRRLDEAALTYHAGPIVGIDAPVMSADAKAQLHAASGAIAVDMESHVAAGYAARRGLPFAGLRIISDDAAHTLPAVAAHAMRADGSVDVWGVLAGLARDPAQLPSLLATGRDAAVAFRALGRVRRLLGRGLGLDL